MVPSGAVKKIVAELDVARSTAQKYVIGVIEVLNRESSDLATNRSVNLNKAIETCMWLFRRAVAEHKLDQALKVIKEVWKMQGLMPGAKGVNVNLGILNTPGLPVSSQPGHNVPRIADGELVKVLEHHNIPVPEQLHGEEPEVIIVSNEQAEEIVDATRSKQGPGTSGDHDQSANVLPPTTPD